jgi:hypothetical protein
MDETAPLSGIGVGGEGTFSHVRSSQDTAPLQIVVISSMPLHPLKSLVVDHVHDCCGLLRSDGGVTELHRSFRVHEVHVSDGVTSPATDL